LFSCEQPKLFTKDCTLKGGIKNLINIHYLDNAATTRTDPAAASKALEMMTENYANPSSLHGGGIRAEAAVGEARAALARLLDCAPRAVVFTSCGTESNNMALFGAAKLRRRRGTHIITGMTEHPSVLQPMRELAAQGFEITYLKPGPDGAVAPEALENALREDTILVSLMLVNNETGAVPPVDSIKNVLKRRGSRALLHCDAVQALLKVPVRAQGIDLLSVSGHKIHAPKGVGALYIREGLVLPPLLHGGGQERGLRSGTESTALIAAFGEACRVGLAHFDENLRLIGDLRARLAEGLRAAVPGARILFSGVPHIVSLTLPGCPAEVVMRILEDFGVYVSTGSACAKGHKSHVLEAGAVSEADIAGTLRVGLSRMNTPEDIDALCAGLAAARARLAL